MKVNFFILVPYTECKEHKDGECKLIGKNCGPIYCPRDKYEEIEKKGVFMRGPAAIRNRSEMIKARGRADT